MRGIENWFVLSEIFGDDFQFMGAEIEQIIDEPLGGTLSIGFIIDDPVLNPPKKWEHWDKVYVRLYFAFIRRLRWQMEGRKPFLVQSMTVRQEDALCMELRDASGNLLEFEFEAARIQNVKPMVYNEEFGRYEVH